MRHSGDPKSSRSEDRRVHDKFIPNKPTEPQLGRIKVIKPNGKIIEIPANRKERRVAVQVERRRLRADAKRHKL